MSVVPSELISEAWTRWQGQVIDGAFPLGRFLGCSDHSGVFLTRSASAGPSEIAIKLIPTERALSQSQLPRWDRAGSLTHPHLLALLDWGECQLDGLPYLYVVMEYADQTLAQLLRHRALTDDEVREMLGPTVDALAFLHGQQLAQGQVKPTNILVVGEQLKLASDTIRPAREGSVIAPSAYDPPEARNGDHSAAGDVWALGVTLLEALTRRSPSDSVEPRGQRVKLPADFSSTLRDILAGCLSPNPNDRPSAADLLSRAGAPAAAVAAPSASATAAIPSAPARRPTAPPRTAAALEATRSTPAMAKSSKPRARAMAVLGAIVIIAVVWSGIHLFASRSTPDPAESASQSQTPAAAPGAADVRTPLSTEIPAAPGQGAGATSSAIHEVIPEVPRGAHRGMRGHIKVWVRVVLDQNGSVQTTSLDRAGPSRYFQRLALEAAQGWRFPPVDIASRRLMQIRFDFSRDSTTGEAVTIN